MLSPTELVKRAARNNLDGLALTDHDCVDGIEEALAAAEDVGIDLIPGIELSVQVGERDIHMLGYWIDHRDPELHRILKELGEMRHNSAERMVSRLQDLGLHIDYADVLEQAGDGNPGRPHVAKALVARGQIHSLEEAFVSYIGDDGPAYVPKSLMDPQRSFDLMKRYGGVPVFAHPALTDYERLLPDFVERGMVGLEVDHPKHTAVQRDRLRAQCRELGLVATGGSDFHMPGASNRELGAEGVAGDTLAELKARRSR